MITSSQFVAIRNQLFDFQPFAFDWRSNVYFGSERALGDWISSRPVPASTVK